MLTEVNKKEKIMISNALEEYLKNMYILEKQNNEIRVTDVANKMNCSKPSVNKALNNLNLEYRIVYFESVFDEDIVLYQEIESGSLIHKNNKSVIDIYVSKNTIN